MPDREQYQGRDSDGWGVPPGQDRTKINSRPASEDDHGPRALAEVHADQPEPPSAVLIGGREFRYETRLTFGTYVFELRTHETDDGESCTHIFTVWKSKGAIPTEDRKEFLPGSITVLAVYERHDINRSRTVKSGDDNPPDELYELELSYCGEETFQIIVSDRDLEPSTRGPKWPRLTKMSRFYASSRQREKFAAVIRAAVAAARTDGMPVRYLFTQTGPLMWRGTPMYLTPTGAFTPDGWTDEFRADMRVFSETEGVSALGYRDPDPATVKDGLRELLSCTEIVPQNPAEIGALMGCQITATVAGLYPWGRLAVMVAGEPGQGKTTVARLFVANQSATARGMDLPVTIHIRNVLSSFNGALMDLEALGGHAALVDDVQTKDTKHAARAATFVSAVVGSLYDGPGSKQTWGTDGPAKAKTYAANGNVILTAERPPKDEAGSSSESTRARMAIVWHIPGSVDTGARSRLQREESEELRYNASCFIVKWVYSHLEKVQELYREADQIVSGWGNYPSDHVRERYVRTVAGNLILCAVCKAQRVKFTAYRDRVLPALKRAYEAQLWAETPEGSQAALTDTVAALREAIVPFMTKSRFVLHRLHKPGGEGYMPPARHPEIPYAWMGWAEQKGIPVYFPERSTPLGEIRDPECPGRPMKIGGRVVNWAVRFNAGQWALFHTELSDLSKRHEWHLGTREELWECALKDGAAKKTITQGIIYYVLDLEWLFGVGPWAESGDDLPDDSESFPANDLPGKDDIVLTDDQ